MRVPRGQRLCSWLGVVPFAAAVGWLHLAHGVPLKVFLYGSGSWGVGCLVKMLVYHLVVRRLPHDPGRLLGTSAVNGVASGAAELGAALLFFAFIPPLGLWEVVAFGVGIGAVEAALVGSSTQLFAGTPLEASARAFEEELGRLSGPRRCLYGYLWPVGERLIAAALHVGTRGLAYVACRGPDPLPLLLALATFVVADGVVGYRLICRQDVIRWRTLNLMYAVLAALGAGVVLAFLHFWRYRGLG